MLKQYERYINIKFGHGVKEMSIEELQQQLANLQICKEDPNLLKKFRSYLQGLNQEKAA